MSQAADRVDAQTAARPGAPTTHPEFDRLVRTMWRLRQPDGCPWDREQTHRSITKNMVEEAYEAVEAIEADDTAHLVEELGDVLEQVVLHAQIAADDGAFTIDDVVRGLNEKLVRRHPHVFGEHAAASDGGEVVDIWDDVKAAERAAEFGDLLFSLVNVARWEGIDAEEALAGANRKFRRRWSRVEELARERGLEAESLGDDLLNELWERAKAEEKA